MSYFNLCCFRPILLLYCLILTVRLYSFLLQAGVRKLEIHTFLPCTNTSDTNAVDIGKYCGALFVDLIKDTVDHALLMQRLGVWTVIPVTASRANSVWLQEMIRLIRFFYHCLGGFCKVTWRDSHWFLFVCQNSKWSTDLEHFTTYI